MKEVLYREAFDIWARTLGPEHAHSGRALRSLASLHVILERYDEAERLFQQALPILAKRYGPAHPETLAATADFAVLLRRTGRKAEALPLERNAKMLMEQHGRENLGAETVDLNDLRER